MANILITNFCNSNCPYCFAKEKVSLNDLAPVDARQTMSMADFERVLDWLDEARAEGTNTVKLLGGEPTLHPQFIDFVKLSLERGFLVQIFSNGMIPTRHLDAIEPLLSDKVGFLLNTNERSFYRRNQIEAMERSWKLLGERANLGFNITAPDFDLSFHEEIILEHGLGRHVRLGLAVPIIGKQNLHLPREQYRETGRRIVEWSRRLVKNDILLNLDCGFPVCMFDRDELGDMTLNTLGFRSLCQPIIDIGTDLSVWSCFPLSPAATFHLDGDLGMDGMVERFHEAYKPFKQMGIFPECRQCEYLKRGQCRAGCLGYTLADFAAGGDSQFLERFKRNAAKLGEA